MHFRARGVEKRCLPFSRSYFFFFLAGLAFEGSADFFFDFAAAWPNTASQLFVYVGLGPQRTMGPDISFVSPSAKPCNVW